MSKRIEYATNLYLEGIKEGNYVDAINKYTGEKYTQHSTGVKNGREGFIEFFSDFVKRNPVRDIKIVRAFEDGKNVFVQAFQSLNKGEYKYVTTDIFDTDSNEKIIEHWDVISVYTDPNQDGNDPVNGETELKDLDKTKINKALISELFDNVLLSSDLTLLSDYIDEKITIHNGDVRNGFDSFKNFLDNEETKVRYNYKTQLIGQGNFVVTLSSVHWNDVEKCQMDIFRLNNGKIVEHWINKETILDNVLDYNSGKF